MKPDFAFLLTEDTSTPRYGEQRWLGKAQLVTIADDSTPRNIASGSFFDGTLGYEGITVETQLPASWAKDGTHGFTNVCFESVLHFSLREMVEGGKVAAKIQRSLDKATAELGTPDTNGALLWRVAKALGVTTFVVQKTPMVHGTYSSAEWTFIDALAASYWMDSREDAYIAKHRVAVPA